MRTTRLAWWPAGLAVLAGLVYLMATAKHRARSTRPRSRGQQSHATVVFNSAIIVFREGLEAVLIFAAVTASFLGANRAPPAPVVAGAAVAFGAAVVTWFAVQALLDAASPLGPRLEAITGFIAIVVLLVVLNWFVHKVYWSEWIGRHHRQRRKLLAPHRHRRRRSGLVALGFTSVYREGFEVVLFLQNLELQAGTRRGARGRRASGWPARPPSACSRSGCTTSCPTSKMLVLTGVLVGVVLVVMTGGTALTFQDLGWLPRHQTPFTLPDVDGRLVRDVLDLGDARPASSSPRLFVIGSYFLAERGQGAAARSARGEAPACARGAAGGRLAPIGVQFVAPERRSADLEGVNRFRRLVAGRRRDQTDELTGLPNRRRCSRAWSATGGRAPGRGWPWSTSTASRSSTTRSATTPATRCCPARRRG